MVAVKLKSAWRPLL